MTLESKIKRQIKDYIESVGGYWAMIAGGAYVKTGDPDMIVCIDGRFIAIEGKTPTGKQSYWQEKRQKEIERAGGTYILARSFEDVKKIIEQEKRSEKNDNRFGI